MMLMKLPCYWIIYNIVAMSLPVRNVFIMKKQKNAILLLLLSCSAQEYVYLNVWDLTLKMLISKIMELKSPEKVEMKWLYTLEMR